MRQRRVIASIVLVLALGALGITAAGASAQDGSVPASVTVKDPAGDVQIFPKARGLTRAQRTSIDLRRVTLTPRASSVRLVVEMRAVLRRPPMDQMVFLRLSPAEGSVAGGRGDIGFSPQRPGLSYAALDTDGTGTSWESCDPMRAKVRRGAGEVALDVPLRCIPAGELEVEVTSLTGYFRSDAARPWSRDRLTLRSPVVLR